MEIFGSYMKRVNTLPGESIRICVLDTFVALMSGMIIFPACFAYGIQPDAGPSLIFITLTEVFINMPGGQLWGSLFFVFMTFASFTTVIAVFENICPSAAIPSAGPAKSPAPSTQWWCWWPASPACWATTSGAA